MTVVPKIRRPSLGRFLAFPENQAAVLAVQDVLDFLDNDRDEPSFNPLLLHGPSGVGKTFLVTALEQEAKRRGRAPLLVSGRELRLQPRSNQGAETESIFTAQLGERALTCDLLIVEDLQAFPLA